MKSDLAEGGAKNPHDVNVDAGSDDGSDMTSSDEESEEEEEGERDIMHTPYGMDGSTGGDDYGSNDSYSTAGESGTYATQSSYSYSISANNEQWNKNTKNNGAGTGNGIGDSSLVDGWIAIVHAKLAATKLARRMKRKLAVDMARRANDHDLAKALPEAVDGCVSPHMNMIALLSYGGGGKGGSGYHLQVRGEHILLRNYLIAMLTFSINRYGITKCSTSSAHASSLIDTNIKRMSLVPFILILMSVELPPEAVVRLLRGEEVVSGTPSEGNPASS